MKKVNFIVSIIIIFSVAIVGVLWFSDDTKENVYINESESYFNDFKVEGDKVHIICDITIENISNKDSKIKLKASFPDDVNSLLKQEELYGINIANQAGKFSIPANSQKMIQVDFIGDFAGTNVKHDRLLPKIAIEY